MCHFAQITAIAARRFLQQGQLLVPLVAVIGLLIFVTFPAFAFTVEFNVPNSFESPIIQGSTNLPDGTQIIVSLRTPAPACIPHCLMWQADFVVKRGRFVAGPFGNTDPGISS